MAEGLTADSGQSPAPALIRPGAVILTRHGEPALSRKVLLSAKAYGEWWGRYELGGLKADQAPPTALKQLAARAGTILSSTRLRARETAQAVADGRPFVEEPILIEAPLPPPPLPEWIRMSPKLWGFTSRVWWWFFNHHAGGESRAEAEARADEAAVRLMALATDGREVLVLAHGFFNTLIGRALKARGWKCTLDQGFQYWCMKRFEPR
jgi:broad specificity phosphatase PhoE